MLKKMLVFSLALGGITTFNNVKAFEFPEKVPFGKAANVNFATSTFGEVKYKTEIILRFRVVLITALV